MKCSYQIGKSLIASILSITIIVTSSGCATSGPHFSGVRRMEDMRQHAKSIAVVPAAAPPQGQFFAYAKSIGEGGKKGASSKAAEGAVQGALMGSYLGIELSMIWMMTSFTVPPAGLIVGSTAVVSAIGAAAGSSDGRKIGASLAVPADEAHRIEALISEMTASANVQDKLAGHVAAAAANLTSSSFSIERQGGETGKFDVVIETRVIRLGFMSGYGRNPSSSFFAEAEIRASLPQSRDEAYRRTIKYVSKPKRLALWAADNWIPAKAELESALASLAEQSAADLFLLRDFYRGERQCFALAGREEARLFWEAFPNEQDRRADPEGSARISDVSYDIMIWRSDPWQDVREISDREVAAARISAMDWEWQTSPRFRPDPDVIYGDNTFMVHQVQASPRLMPVMTSERSVNSFGVVADTRPVLKQVLVAVSDREIQLAMDTNYECSVRARFKIDDQTRQTGWSPYFTFKTPKEPEPTYSKPEQVIGRTFYTRINMWYEKPDKIYTTNFHQGALFPLGTRVTITEVSNTNLLNRYIRFKNEAGESYRLIFQARHEREGIGLMHMFDHYFSASDPLVEGSAFRALSAAEQENVRAGKVGAGMTKEAVIMAFGYPPSRRTPSLVQNSWIYWLDFKQMIVVRFENGRVVP